MLKHKLLFNIVVLVFLPAFMYGQNHKTYFKTAEEFYAAGNYNDAIEQLTKSVEIKPDFEEAYYLRAQANNNLGNPEKALEDLNRLLTLNAEDANYLLMAGQMSYKIENYDAAIDFANKAITEDKKLLEAYFLKTESYFAKKDFVQANSVATEAVMIKETPEALYFFGVSLYNIQQYEQSELALKDVILYEPQNIDGFIALARSQLQLKKYDAAVLSATEAINLNNQSADAYWVRSEVYRAQKKYSEAINDMSQIAMFQPNNAVVFFQRATYYFEFTQYQSAINDYSKVLSLEPENYIALQQRAVAYEQAMNPQKAVQDYEKLMALSGNDAELLLYQKKAEERLFELRWEDVPPVIVIVEPETNDGENVMVAANKELLVLKVKLQDDNKIDYLKVNGTKGLYEYDAENDLYIITLNLLTSNDFTLTASDIYNNVQTKKFVIKKIEVNPPVVTILNPYASDNGEIFLQSNEPNVFFEGKVVDESLIKEIILNETAASYVREQKDPVFNAIVNLNNVNILTVKVVDIYGNTTEKHYTINRSGAELLAENPMGKTWVIFIENSNYASFASLDGPSKDVNMMKNALKNYQIHNIIHKKDMTKQQLERFFSLELRDLVRDNQVNSLLVWFAGHGKYINETGYWIPVDARRDDEFSYFNINNLKASMQSYSRYITHTLVVTDACESGPSFYQAMRSEDVSNRSCDDPSAIRFKSSQVFSSAGYELAVDNSQFTKTFANSLNFNSNSCIPIENIVQQVTVAVTQSNQQKPKFGKISGLEDENGTFFFMKR